jgi:hypothetical protein
MRIKGDAGIGSAAVGCELHATADERTKRHPGGPDVIPVDQTSSRRTPGSKSLAINVIPAD